MQKSYKKKSLLTIVMFCLLMMFCIPLVGVFAEETTEPDKTPNFKFLNTPYKGVTVKLNTYDYTNYWDKIHSEENFSTAEAMREQYTERYTVNQLAIDEFSVILKGSTDGKEYKLIAGAGYKRYNQSGMYYYTTISERKYIICPTGTADFTVYYRNDDGNIVHVFDTEELTRSNWHDMTIQDKYNEFDEAKKTQFKSADIETRLTLLFGNNKFFSEFTTENGIFYLFDGDWADFDHVHENESRNFIKAYTTMKATTEDKFQSVEDINSERLIPYEESGKENEHTNQKKYTGVYKNTNYFSSESDFGIYKDGLTTLYVNEYFGLSEDELQIEKAVDYWSDKTNPLDDSFEFTIKIADKNISESEEYQYYISNAENPPETAKINGLRSAKNAVFKLKGGETLHIIGLIEGQNVLVQEAAYAGYGIVTDEKVTYDTTNGYHTDLQYKKTDNKRTFTNYPLAMALTKKVTNYADNQETVDDSEFVFELCKQENNTITPLTEEEMLGIKAWVVENSEFIKLDFGGSVGNQFTLKHGQTVVITGIKADTQYVAREIDCKISGESSNSSYQKRNNGLTYLKSTPAITETSSPNYQTNSFSGTQENTYQNKTGLTVSKQIENDYNTLTNPNAEYLFQILQVTKENDTTTETPLNKKKYTLNGLVEQTTTEQGYFTLKQNEYAFFSIPQAGTFKVIEIDPNKKYSDIAYQNSTTGLLAINEHFNNEFDKMHKNDLAG